MDDPANLASGEESNSDIPGPSSLGPIRGRQHLQVRTSPYERNEGSSSRSSSPLRLTSLGTLPPLQTEGSSSRSPSLLRRTSLGTLSPLHIPLPLGHLSAQPVPSPLNQVAFSHPNSPSPSHSDNEMNVDNPDLPLDEAELPFDEEEVLAKASFAIIPLPYYQTIPPMRLLICTKCQHGVLASSLISHSNGHGIRLLKADKQNLQKIVDNSSFLDDSEEVASPASPCPPIEGIKMQDGLSCNVCHYCCIGIRTMQSHFSIKHKDVVGFAKDNSKLVQVQALFARRPKYFVVTPSLRGLNEDDLFTIYLRQCVPEIEALQILNPPISPNEVPPLLKVTQWHEHLKDYTTDRESVRKLLELVKLPTLSQGQAWMGSPLQNTIEAYLKDVQVKANNATLGIRCLLKECPRFFNSFNVRL